ncbi:MAG: carboxylesterase family protein, partial [Clostridia bacterium]|nr:carboxylesterase family protein [Clostridia bacterium]
PYWKEFMETAGCKDLEELKTLPLEKLFAALEALKATRNDNIYNTMPVIDGYLIEAPVDKLIKNPLKVGYMIGYTNTDMYAPIMEYIGNKFGKKNGAYIYFFDIDAPGDENGAFHSCDIRYMFGTLEDSWRPYGERDREASDQLSSYVANYAKTGDPNGEGLPEWTPARPFTFAKAMRFAPEKTAEGRAHYLKLLGNMLKKGDPKA